MASATANKGTQIGSKTKKDAKKAPAATAAPGAEAYVNLVKSEFVAAREEFVAALDKLTPKNWLTAIRRDIDNSNLGGYFTNGVLLLMVGASSWFLGEKAYSVATSVDDDIA